MIVGKNYLSHLIVTNFGRIVKTDNVNILLTV